MANQFNSGTSYVMGQQITSDNGQARLVFQGDGNLVLYVQRRGKEIARWASNTVGKLALRLEMQGDGNLVIYNTAGQPCWASNTWGNPGADLVLQDDENAVIYSLDGKALWSSDSWVGQWKDCSFDISKSGLRFSNDYPSVNLALGIMLSGLCGGMTYTTLDYHYSGIPSSMVNSAPSTDTNVLGNYIKGRHLTSLVNYPGVFASVLQAILGVPLPILAASIAGMAPNYNLQQFIAMQLMNDKDIRNRSFDVEFTKIRQQIDANKPVSIGLITSDGNLFHSHQVVAIGYRDGVKDRYIKVFDQNHPGGWRSIWISKDNLCEQSTGQGESSTSETWRGLFLETYTPVTPPHLGINDNQALSGKVFDADFYLAIHSDLSAAFGTSVPKAKEHWIQFGVREGRNSGLALDPSYYLANHSDLIAAFGVNNFESSIEHWLNFGINEGRRSSFEFDVKWYLSNHQDLVNAFGATNFDAAVNHWITYGLNEGRQSSSQFNIGFYLNYHTDLVNAFGAGNHKAAFQHWYQFGRSEGRKTI